MHMKVLHMVQRTETPAAGISPELRVTGFYLTLLMTSGVSNVFAGIWFTGMGISPGEIGLINAAPVLVLLLINVFVGRIADRASDWRSVIVIGMLLGGVIPAGLFFAHNFWTVLIVWTLGAIPIAAVVPVVDAATLRLTRRNGSDFGRIRSFGTIGYMAAIFACGFVVTWFGASAFLPLLVGVALLRAVAALALPNFRAPKPEEGSAVAKPRGAGSIREVMKPWFLLPLVGWSMVFGTHIILDAFLGLIWKQQGISEAIIGPLMALGAASEAIMMFFFSRFTARFSARSLILASGIVAVIRWTVMGFSPPVPLLVVMQLFHSITFAMGFMGSVHFIANWTSENIAAEAQSVFSVLQKAMAIIAVIGFGWLVGLMGAHAFFVAATFAAIGSVMIWASMRLQQPKAEMGNGGF